MKRKNKIISSIIAASKINEILRPHSHLQLNLKSEDLDINLKFQRYLISIAEKYFLDELTSFQRIETDKSLDDVFKFFSESSFIFSGIQIKRNPIFKVQEWEKWEGGFIRGFCKFYYKEDEKNYFIFTYIKMEKLEDILKKWINEFDLEPIKKLSLLKINNNLT